MRKYHKCGHDDCEKDAQYCYAPGYSSGCSPYFCDEHVPRGCAHCNLENINENRFYGEDENMPDYLPEGGVEGVDWEWVNKIDGVKSEIPKNYYWQYLDKGREYPCSEYDYSEKGFVTEEYEQYLEHYCKEINYDLLQDEIVQNQNWFKEHGEYFWSDELIEKVEKIIKENDK
jgi:hypothetical protein